MEAGLFTAGASIIAAVVAAIAAVRARRFEAEANRLRDLEARLATRKYEVYEPMIELLRETLDTALTEEDIDQERFTEETSKFSSWVAVFGSDDAVQLWGWWMQATYHAAPANILLRLYAEFVIAARRDMGYEDTKISASDFLAIRIKDLYDGDRPMHERLNEPLVEMAETEGWSIPWPLDPSQMSEHVVSVLR